ncbi:MAG: hypothetical protein IPG48_02610 [Saprospiraceae bacterium]|nr:hypothetical protein [Saprospiraceae bacterium]
MLDHEWQLMEERLKKAGQSHIFVFADTVQAINYIEKRLREMDGWD